MDIYHSGPKLPSVTRYLFHNDAGIHIETKKWTRYRKRNSISPLKSNKHIKSFKPLAATQSYN